MIKIKPTKIKRMTVIFICLVILCGLFTFLYAFTTPVQRANVVKYVTQSPAQNYTHQVPLTTVHYFSEQVKKDSIEWESSRARVLSKVIRITSQSQAKNQEEKKTDYDYIPALVREP